MRRDRNANGNPSRIGVGRSAGHVLSESGTMPEMKSRIAGGGPAGVGRGRHSCDRTQPARADRLVVAGAARLTAEGAGPVAQQGGPPARRRTVGSTAHGSPWPCGGSGEALFAVAGRDRLRCNRRDGGWTGDGNGARYREGLPARRRAGQARLQPENFRACSPMLRTCPASCRARRQARWPVGSPLPGPRMSTLRNKGSRASAALSRRNAPNCSAARTAELVRSLSWNAGTSRSPIPFPFAKR